MIAYWITYSMISNIWHKLLLLLPFKCWNCSSYIIWQYNLIYDIGRHLLLLHNNFYCTELLWITFHCGVECCGQMSFQHAQIHDVKVVIKFLPSTATQKLQRGEKTASCNFSLLAYSRYRIWLTVYLVPKNYISLTVTVEVFRECRTSDEL